MRVDIRLLTRGDEALLARAAPGVFGHEIKARSTLEFLNDPRHYMAVAIADGTIVGFASGVRYTHPDKSSELWINEVTVAADYRRRGLGKAVIAELLKAGQNAGCTEAWLLTHRSNPAAMKLYAGMGGTEAPEDQVMFTFRLNAL